VGLESYLAAREQLSVGLGDDLFPGATLVLGVGAEQLDVFDLQDAQGLTRAPDVGPSSQLRPLLSGTAHLVLDPDEIRRDRRHELELSARFYPVGGGDTYGLVGYRYEKVFEFGWHDLWLSSRGGYLWGTPPFIEEQPVGGQHLRGVFGDRFFTRRIISGALDARASITRDVYKFGGFIDVALFADRDRARGTESVRAAVSVGPSLHLLLADAFQLDLYYGLGLAAHTPVDRGFTASLRQAF
jgi:hypothetical protein